MKRFVDMNVISDGKRYTRKDMARLGCNDCEGCSACCHDMENAVLDPWDVWRLTSYLKCGFEQMIDVYIELTLSDGIILPRLKMDGAGDACPFLNEAGRCKVHAARPGVCRMFPLGRIYEENGFSYFLQTQECHKNSRTKVKIEKWLDIMDLPRYEAYILKWHKLLTSLRGQLDDLDDVQMKTLHMLMLRQFFMTPYEAMDFYGQFEERHQNVIVLLGL